MHDQLCIVAVISPNHLTQEAMADALRGRAEVEALLTLLDYPTSSQLVELGKAPRGCIVFLDFVDGARARTVAGEIERSYPKATVVALHEENDPQDALELMRIGIREVITLPLQRLQVTRVFTRLAQKLMSAPGDSEAGSLYAFMPAKPGAGATTLAAHCGSAAARLSDERLLLMDLDFRLGMTSFLFQLHEDSSVLKALALLEKAGFAGDFWEATVSRRGMLDILGSASMTYGGFDPERDVVRLVDLARRKYRAVFVDLPGEMRDYETDIITQAKECFIVCTPDLGTLHVAKRKAKMLVAAGIQSNISVIMNQIEGRGGLAVKDVESILRLPVRFTVSTSVKEVTEATRAGKAIEGRSSLAKQIETIGKYMSVPKSTAAPAKRRFLDMFSISEVRDHL